MAINNDSFYKYEEKRAQTGYKTAILVKENGYYNMLVASETVPSVFGEQESFDFDLLNMPTKGKVAGKTTLEDKDVEFLYHRDNIYRLNKLVGNVLDFITLTPDFVAYKFSGTISQRMNDSTDDILRGTYTITAMSANPTPIFNGRGLSIQETLCFAGAIPENVIKGSTLNLSVVQTGATVTYSYKTISGENNTEGNDTDITSDVLNGEWQIPNSVSGLIAITASASNYAPWTTTVYVSAQ